MLWYSSTRKVELSKHLHLLNVARALQLKASLPIEFRSYCVLASGYLNNQTPMAVLNEKTPYESLQSHGMSLLCTQPKTWRWKFCYSDKQVCLPMITFRNKGWRVYNTETGIVSVFIDFIFLEIEFSFATDLQNDQNRLTTPTIRLSQSFIDNDFLSPHIQQSVD